MKKPSWAAVIICLFALFILPHKTFAGFPIGKYRDLVVPSFSYYTQTDHYDINGNVVKGSPGARFSSYSTYLYFGYGLSRRLDLIVTVPFLYQVNNLGNGNKITTQGAGDMVAGLSYNLVNFKYLRYLSVQVSGVIPLYSVPANTTSALGLGDNGAEIKLSYCGNLPKSLFDKGYFNTEIGYRRYFNYQGPNQYSFLGTIGYPISWHNQLSFDLVLLRSLSPNTAYNSNYNAERDYGFVKPQLNFGHQFTRRFSVFIGGYYVPIGINTGVGYGGSAVAILKL